ncbi:MAG: hypothetical protein KDA41_08835, partial [Planctomycetales bacterium]|nr:hypothetical protein [Planctomycetales bacterium]
MEIERYDPDLPIVVNGEQVLPEVDPTKRRRQTVSVTADGSAAVQFSVAGLDIGTHHGRVRLDRQDALPIDDVRYFTFAVREPWNVLIAAGPGARAELLSEALAPYEFRVTDQARFRTTTKPAGQIASQELAAYSIVAVVDPPPLPASAWQQLAAYAQRGGAVAIFLGNNADKNSFNDAPAQELLPGRLDLQWISPQRPESFNGRADLYLAPRAMEHPMLAAFREISANVPWYDFPVFRHWSFEGNRLAEGSTVAVRFSNGKPAIVERRLGEGRVLVMTTPISDAARPAGREPWNWLSTGLEPWPYVMLVNEMMLHLAGSGEVQLNYYSGQAPQVTVASGDD